MRTEENRPPDATNVWEWLTQAYGRVKSASILAPIIAALLGVFGFWLSPLKDRVYYHLYPPKPIVEYEIVSLRSPMMRGDTFIVKLHLVPESNSLAAGEILATVPDEYLSLEDGNALVDLDGTEKARIITYKFDTLKAGKPHLKYVYKFARGGSLQRDLELVVVDRKNGFPTFADLSGDWGVMWEKGLGELTITQQETKITGSFSLTEADSKHEVRGDITGFANGYNLRLIFVPDKSKSSDKSTKAMYANLLRVSGRNDLTMCGRINPEKEEPFMGPVVDPNASVQEICKGSNLWAKAQLK